jgi:iron complex transport system ATP-binding protein
MTIGYGGQKTSAVVLHENINVTLLRGEFACLLGPNGAGKSTLLKSLGGFISPLAGRVMVNGEPLSACSKEKLAQTISMVFTERVHVPGLTVNELIALGRSPYTGFFGRLLAEDKRMIINAMEITGIAQMSSRLVMTLSDGELQKVMIAKALVQDTPIILLDEPTAFLDLPSRIETMNLLQKLARETQKGILLSTHDLDLALRMADKIWLLAKGKDMESGTPEDLVLNDEFRHFFEKDGILFDNESGAFKLDRPNVKTIRLIGKGIEYKWVNRALARSGFNTTQNDGNWPQVEIQSNGHREYLLTHPSGSSYTSRSIEDLLAQIHQAERARD